MKSDFILEIWYEICDGIIIRTLVSFSVSCLVHLILMIFRNTTYLIVWMKCVMDLVLGI